MFEYLWSNNIDIAATFVTVAVYLGLGFLVYYRGSKDDNNRTFLFFTFAGALYSIFNYLNYQFASELFVINLIRVTIFFAIWHSYFLYRFFYIFGNRDLNRQKKSQRTITVITAIISLLTLTPLVFTGVEEVAPVGQVSNPIPGPLVGLFVVWVLFLVTTSLVLLAKKIRRAHDVERIRIQYVLIGTVITFSALISFNMLFPVLLNNVVFIKFVPLFTLPFVLFTSYAIIKYKFLDIRIFLRRAFVILGALISSLLLALLLIYFNTSILREAIPSIAMFVFSLLVGILLFSWFQKGFLKIANKYFFTTLYNPQKVTEQLAAAMNKTLELNSLLGLITKQLTSVFGIEQYGFAICDQQKKLNCYVELSNGLDNSSIHLILQQESAIKYLEKTSAIIVTDEISRFIEEETLRPTNTTEQDRNALLQFKGALQQAGIAVCVPMVSGKKLNSLLLLGSKLTKDAFTTEDIHLLETVADQAAVAIDNARLYKEAQEFNLKLKAEVEKATKDLREANEKLKELDEAKSEFMSIASHQLRTPLAGIIGYLSMMVEGDYGKFQKNQMETITEVFHASQRLVHLVNTFLNVTRIEAGRFTLSFVPTNLVEIVDQQVKELLPTANKKGVKLSFAQPKEAIIEAEVDDKIRDVFLNLVDNAIKYTPEGSVTAAIKKDGRDKVHFTCTDTGVGIAKDEVSHLFEKFVRGNSIAKVQPDGSGLGLYIVKRIVEGHNGQLWAESEGVGKGTTFHVVIPVKQKQKQFKAQAEAVFEGKTKPGEGGSTVRKNMAKKAPTKKAQEK